MRIVTLPALSAHPLGGTDAFDLIDGWLAARPAVVVQPTARHAWLLRSLLVDLGTAGNLATDAHLAALALEHGGRICSFDRDFNRFPGVSVFAPV